MDDGWRRLERIAGWACLGAGAVHAALVRDHAREWWGYGLAFFLAGLVQLLVGLALLTKAVTPSDTGASWRRAAGALYGVGLAANLALLLVYAGSRTLGVPFGPEAGEVEPVTGVDLVAKALEIVAAVVLVRLLQRVRREPTLAPASPPAAF